MAANALKNSPRALCTAFLLLFAIPLCIYLTNKFTLQQLDERIQQSNNAISQDVGERIGVINTVLASMAGLQEVSIDLNNDRLLRFSEDILRDASYIRNLGHYKKILADQRQSFEAKLSHNGYSDFSIAQINDQGRFVPRQPAGSYFPISIAAPLRSVPPSLLGTDLAAIPGFSEALTNISENQTSTLLPLPQTWPLNGELIAMRAVFEHDVSADKKSSAANDQSHIIQDTPNGHIGGFWLTLDIKDLFQGLPDAINEFDIEVQLLNHDKRYTVYQTFGKPAQTLYLSSLFPRKRVEQLWPMSASTALSITLRQDVGVTGGTLILSMLSILLITLVTCLLTTRHIKRKHAEIRQREGLQNLFNEREKAEKTLNSVQDAIISLDPELTIAHVNPAATVQFNSRASLIVGKPLSDFVQFHHLSDSSRTINIRNELMHLSHSGRVEIDVVPAGHCEDDFVFRMSLSSSLDSDGNISGHVIVLRDISHEQRLTKKLAYQANFDALTGCTNRYFFEQSLERLLEEMPSSGLKHTLCYIDLDQFKIINDTCGHRAGDQLLIEITKNIKQVIREEDVLSRLGGDEFGLIIFGVDNEEATYVAERIYEFFQSFNFIDQGNIFSVTASIGVVHIDSPDVSSKDIMAAADIACYAAKDNGRNGMSVFSKSDENMAERSEELSWLPRLQTALNNNEFRLHVQAVASLDSNSDQLPVTHFEFLLRLADADGSEVTPWQFIQAAERYDLMRDIDRWVISNALATVAEHSSGPGANCGFSINLSGQSAADPTLKLFILEQMALHDVDPSRIWFELTETAAISHFSVAVDLINNIRSTGAKVALDDFGSGLSSFGYLKNLPVDIIKIDGQFIKEIVKNPIDRQMVHAIHGVGQSMNIQTVAEFVEDQDIVDELRRIGVNYAQGYHIGKPVPVSHAMQQLSNNQKAA